MRQQHTHRAGFTLIELTAVFVLVGILAATAIPTVHRLSVVHEASLAQEVARRLTVARAHATTTGIPTGIRIDLDQQRMPYLTLGPNGIEERQAGLDNAAALRSDRLANISNTTISAVSIPSTPGAFNPNTQNALWFDYQGTPHLRTSTGTPIADLTQPATITVAASFIIVVQPSTGHIAVHSEAAP